LAFLANEIKITQKILKELEVCFLFRKKVEEENLLVHQMYFQEDNML